MRNRNNATIYSLVVGSELPRPQRFTSLRYVRSLCLVWKPLGSSLLECLVLEHSSLIPIITLEDSKTDYNSSSDFAAGTHKTPKVYFAALRENASLSLETFEVSPSIMFTDLQEYLNSCQLADTTQINDLRLSTKN